MADGPSGSRWVEVAPERITTWLENFGKRNGWPVPLTATAYGLSAVAANGTVAEWTVPFAFDWVPPEGEPGPRRSLAAVALALAIREHSLRTRRVGVLLVRLGGHAAGV